jgi:hypothetical protein
MATQLAIRSAVAVLMLTQAARHDVARLAVTFFAVRARRPPPRWATGPIYLARECPAPAQEPEGLGHGAGGSAPQLSRSGVWCWSVSTNGGFRTKPDSSSRATTGDHAAMHESRRHAVRLCLASRQWPLAGGSRERRRSGPVSSLWRR